MHKKLINKYPLSKPCSCVICRSYCMRPGWWSVEQAEKAIECGYASKMMMEVSPEMTFAVLSPAFSENEGAIATNDYSNNGCCFMINSLCALHGKSFYPIECGFCHHERKGQGISCHHDIEIDWNSRNGMILVEKWCNLLHYQLGLQIVSFIHECRNRKSTTDYLLTKI